MDYKEIDALALKGTAGGYVRSRAFGALLSPADAVGGRLWKDRKLQL